jgi:hypothetical protein
VEGRFTKITRDLTNRKRLCDTANNNSPMLFEFSLDAVLACDQEGRIKDVKRESKPYSV